MTFRHTRRAPRLPCYDYSQAGAYFVTVVTAQRNCLLGDPLDPAKQTNVGRMVEACWRWLPVRFPEVTLDYFVIMPNHVHGILVLGHEAESNGLALQEVVRVFKSRTTADYSRGVREFGWTRYNGHLWQRSYYDHVIRKERSLRLLREYIVNNPKAWELDRENPFRKPRPAA